MKPINCCLHGRAQKSRKNYQMSKSTKPDRQNAFFRNTLGRWGCAVIDTWPGESRGYKMTAGPYQSAPEHRGRNGAEASRERWGKGNKTGTPLLREMTQNARLRNGGAVTHDEPRSPQQCCCCQERDIWSNCWKSWSEAANHTDELGCDEPSWFSALTGVPVGWPRFLRATRIWKRVAGTRRLWWCPD